MKLMIASDLHGSAAWVRRLMREYHRIQPDRLVLLEICYTMAPEMTCQMSMHPKK